VHQLLNHGGAPAGTAETGLDWPLLNAGHEGGFLGRVPVACGEFHPSSTPGKMPLYHTSAREHCHDSAPYLLPAGNCGTPVALHHAALRVARPRRGVTSTTGSTCALQEQAQTRPPPPCHVACPAAVPPGHPSVSTLSHAAAPAQHHHRRAPPRY